MNRHLMCQVNLADDQAFRDNLALLENYQADQYRDANSQYKRMGNNVYRFRERYFDNARFLIYAKMPCAQKFARCGMTVNKRPAYCKNRKFCTCCAYKFGTDVYERFQDCFHGRTSYFCTLGFRHQQGLSWADRDNCDLYWKAASYAIDKVMNYEIDGALITRELHLRGLGPTFLNPHTHAILSFSGFTGAFDLEQSLHDAMVEFINQQEGLGVRLVPDVKLRLIEDVADFESSIRYQFKAIEIKPAYESAIILHGSAPEALTALNSDLTDFLKWFGLTSTMEKRLRCKGVFHPRNSDFVGIKLKELKRNRRDKAQTWGRPNNAQLFSGLAFHKGVSS